MVAALVAGHVVVAQDTTAPPPPPNIVLLLADDQRPDSVGAFGNPHAHTPHLDGLVAEGFRFRNAYCLGSVHGAVCQPSRAMLLSGRTLWRAPLDLADVDTLPEVLGRHGYTTFGTGKWHNGAASFERAFQRGRAVMLGGMSNHEEVPLRDLTAAGTLTEPRTDRGFSSEIFADAAVDFIETQARHGEAPFFAYVAFTAPHDPRQPPEPFRSQAYADPPPLPANFLPLHSFDNGWLTGRDEKLGPWPRPAELIRDQLAEYYGLIAHLDAQVGRILATLERTGLGDNTIVIYTADHGLALGSHGLLGKQSVYEHSMGCPLIIRGPGIPHGTSAALVYLLDLLPTICDLAGLATPAGVEGQTLAPQWRSTSPPAGRNSLFLAYEDLMRAVRDARFKLIRYPHSDRDQLFDLQRDPEEIHDLADAPEHAERVLALRRKLEQWQQRLEDPHPLDVTEPRTPTGELRGQPRQPDPWQPDWIVEKYFEAPNAGRAANAAAGYWRAVSARQDAPVPVLRALSQRLADAGALDEAHRRYLDRNAAALSQFLAATDHGRGGFDAPEAEHTPLLEASWYGLLPLVDLAALEALAAAQDAAPQRARRATHGLLRFATHVRREASLAGYHLAQHVEQRLTPILATILAALPSPREAGLRDHLRSYLAQRGNLTAAAASARTAAEQQLDTWLAGIGQHPRLADRGDALLAMRDRLLDELFGAWDAGATDREAVDQWRGTVQGWRQDQADVADGRQAAPEDALGWAESLMRQELLARAVDLGRLATLHAELREALLTFAFAAPGAEDTHR
ncbi:MAG: sulfatase-like hydrolase/transferase [Planctomycetota bacterium]